jgi:hypothetical protein
MLSGEAMDMHGREKYVKDLRILLKDAYEVHKMANAAYKADETDKNKQTLEMANVTIKAILIGLLAYSTTLHTKGRNITTLEDALLGTKLILGAAGGYSNIGVAGVNLAAAFRLGSVATNAVHLGIKIEDDRKNVEYGNPQKGEHGRVFRVYIAKSIADTNARLPKKVSLDTKTDKWAAVELRNPHIEAFENKNTVAGGKTNSKTISANQSPPVTEKAKAHTSNVDYVTKSRASRDLGRGGAAIAMP